MQVQLGTEVFAVTPGTMVLIPAGTPHCYWNDGTEDELRPEVCAPAPPADNIVIPAEPRAIRNAGDLGRQVRPDGYRTSSPGFTLQPLAQLATGSKTPDSTLPSWSRPRAAPSCTSTTSISSTSCSTAPWRFKSVTRR